jgi:hypothetical protein
MRVNCLFAATFLVLISLCSASVNADTTHSLTSPAAITSPTPVYPPVPTEIKTADYHDYQDCKLMRVEADGVVISHRLGVAKLMFYSMPPEFQKAYGYDPVAAKQATDEQEAKNAASDAMAARQTAIEKKNQNQGSPTVISIGTTSAPSATKTPTVDSASIQSRINELQADISFMQREEAKLYQDNRTLKANGATVTRGGYTDKIAEEQAQVAQLQRELK